MEKDSLIPTKHQEMKNMTPEFTPWPKIPRLSREVIVTEKIDGTNASIYIVLLENDQIIPAEALCVFSSEGLSYYMLAGSRSRWITPANDNDGFAAWAKQNAEELQELGPGHHFGEWWGSGIQRSYGLAKGDRRFSLFNTSRWSDSRPKCCDVVPVLYRGMFDTDEVNEALFRLEDQGSVVAPGFMKPEGIVVFHIAANVAFKKTVEKDEQPKGL